MTTKKIIIIVAAIIAVLGLIVLLFVGGIIGAVFYGISNSDAAVVARDFLRSNERLKQDIGDVKDFGSLVKGNIDIRNGDGTAELSLKVIGTKKTVNASVELMYRSGHQWRVTAASYQNDAGETIDLLKPYESINRLRRQAA
ncbi:MAG TPA: cytochrome c oxidase assembly factor Coa1 family protein [Pyrinomonadaceae bacterium]|nr:cytochrome c oxidase assembly factor Coa1 family protein [Pyrinomonadaceae bacterium]